MKLGSQPFGILVAAAMLAAIAWAVPGQTAKDTGGSSQRFEVASVRPVPPGHEGMFSMSPWGSDLFVAGNISLRNLIALAYGIDSSRITGLADRVANEEFDVEARVEGQQKLSYGQMQPLLENLLRDRFALLAHRGSRMEEGYALVVGKHGAKLKANQETAKGMPSILPDEIYGQGITMETLAGLLARLLGRPVMDKTGLTGTYDLALHYRANDSEDADLPSIFTALEEQLGLKAVKATVPVAVLVVDRVNPEPAAQ